jgi:SAM-dependent methyltransferase
MTDLSQGAIAYRDRCPSCGAVPYCLITREPFDSGALRLFFENHYEGRANIASLKGYEYELVRCVACGLAYQRSVPAGDLISEIYEEWIPPRERERLHELYTLNDFCYWAEQVQFVVQHFNMPPHALRILDFGMGWAEWALMAKAFGCQVAGSELSAARLQHARSIGIETLTWDQLPGRKFHFINTEQVFEHLLEPALVLKHLARSLDDGGILKISVPNCRSVLRKLSRRHGLGSLSSEDIIPVAPLEHINCFDYRSLVTFARHASLRPLRPRLRLIYNSSSGWLSPRRALRLALRPVYRHLFPKSTYVLLVKEERDSAVRQL